MKAARARLIVAAVLIVGWLGYLGYLALGQSKPIVLSRSQLLHATHFVKADVALDAGNKPNASIKVVDSFGRNRIADETVEVVNVADVRLPDGKPLPAGTFFLPLVAIGPQKYRVVSPLGPESQAKVTAYPWSDDVERQVRELVP